MHSRNLTPFTSFKTQRGSSLIEVLITMLIVALGLLGAGGLQLASTRYQQTSFMRSQGIVQAQFISEKIRANSSAAIASAPPNQASTYLAPDDYASATLAALPADPGCGLTAASTCTTVQSAVRDMRDWRLSLQGLPGGRGSIFPVTNAAGVTDPVARQVVVMWQEKQQNEVGTTANPNPDSAPIDATCPAPRVGGVRCLTLVITP
jgi:type IV pilus assembly protein PilV